MSTQLDQSSSKKKASKTRRADGSTKSSRSQKSARSEKSTRSGKSGKSGRSNRSERSEKSGRSGKSSRSSKAMRFASKELPSLTGSVSQSREPITSKKEDDADKVKLMFKGGNRKVKIADLVAISSLMKQRQSEGRLAKAVDLKEFTPECVNLIADYIEKQTVKTSVSFFVLAEVLKLSKAFVMEDLHKKIEEVLIVAATQSAPNLLQSIFVADTSSVSRETETSLHYLAAWRFLELARLDDFQKISANQFMMIFGSCELNVPQELVAVDAALLWLAGQRNLEILAPAVFGLVRSTHLGKVERNMIIERTTVLNFPDQVTHAVSVLLNSRNNNRICFTPEHIKRHLVRCGLADAKSRKEEMSLPLSRPRPGLIRKKEEDKSSRSKKKAEKSGKKSRKSERSSRSEKSSKSHRSSKSRRGTSEKSKSEKSSKRTSSRRAGKHQKMSSAISDAKTK